jgi:hypothetical protein
MPDKKASIIETRMMTAPPVITETKAVFAPNTAGGIQGGRFRIEEILPEREVFRLNRDQLVKRVLERGTRDVTERAIERQIKKLIKDKPPGKTRILLRLVFHRHHNPERLSHRDFAVSSSSG